MDRFLPLMTRRKRPEAVIHCPCKALHGLADDPRNTVHLCRRGLGIQQKRREYESFSLCCLEFLT